MSPIQGASLEAPYSEITAEEFFTAGAIIALATGDSTMDYHLIPNFHVVDFAADFRDNPGGIRAGNVRQDDRHSRQTAPRPDIIEVAARSLHLDENVIGTGPRNGRILVLEYLTTSISLKNDGFHWSLFSRALFGKVCQEGADSGTAIWFVAL
jgi:hypothetical protein